MIAPIILLSLASLLAHVLFSKSSGMTKKYLVRVSEATMVDDINL